MGAIQVKNVPEDLHDAIRTRARNEGMTVGEYILDALRRDLALPSQREWLARIAEREPIEGVDAAALIREGRAERGRQIAEALRR